MTCSASSRTARSAKSSAAAARPNAPSASRTGAGQLEGGEQPRAHARPPQIRSADASSVSPAESRRTRCIATVVDRSRTSARPPGSRDRAGDPAPVGPGDREADEPDRLRRRPAARAGDAGDPDADVGAQARPRAVRERLGDLDRHGADARRSGPPGTPASARLRRVRVHDEPAEDVVRRARKVGQAARRAGRRCTTRPSRSSSRRRAQQGRDLLVDRRAVRREQRVGVALADDRLEGRVGRARPPARSASRPRARRAAGRS